MAANRQETKQPDLSVVVGVIAGGKATMQTCLRALAKSSEGIDLECLVPYDARLDDAESLQKEFPWAFFIDLREEIQVEKFGSGSREHHDLLRAAGLNRANGSIVALLEDHGTPAPGWCQAVLKSHGSSEAAVVGGAVENGVDRILNWAVYYCDFGRYQNPVPDGNVEFASDSNVSYKSEAILAVKHVWNAAYHETSVHWEIRRRGGTLELDPEMVVYQTRRTLRFVPALKERFVWGRSFAGTRSAEVNGVRRATFASLSFVLPFVLTARIVLKGVEKRRNLGKLMRALPLIFLLQIFWAIGEFVGYVTGRAERGTSSHAQESPDTASPATQNESHFVQTTIR